MRKMQHVLTVIVICVIVDPLISNAENCKGCVPLDSFSFDKVVPRFKAALVKFDVAFPYGDKQEEFAKFAAYAKDAKDLLVAEVGIKDYGNKDNSDLAERYEIKKTDYPTVLLFLQGSTSPFQFSAEKDSDFTADNIRRFVKLKSGVYLGLPGCVEKLDNLAKEFRSATSEKDRKEILQKAKVFEETLSEGQRAAAKVYVKTMERMMERGDVFVQTEQTRLEGLLRGKISEEKKRTMEERRNILQSFALRDEL